MTGKVKLELSHDDLHTLATLGQTKRGTLTKIPKVLLNKLLVDHTRLVQYAKSQDALSGIV